MPTDEEIQEVEARLAAACKKVDSDLPPAAERHREAARRVVDQALALARVARKARSNPNLPVVRPEEPLPEGDITKKFRAFKPE